MKTYQIYVLLFVTMIAFACGGDKKEDTASKDAVESQPANMEEALSQAQEALKNVNIQQGVEPVNFRALKELMPAQLAGFERQKLSGESAGAMNMKISKAEGKYRDASGKNLDVDIVDMGGIGMGMMGMAAWATVTIDKEDDNGYERTSTLDGYKCFEEFRNDGSSSKLSVLAEDRFVIALSCRGCSMESMRSAVKELDLGKLKGLK